MVLGQTTELVAIEDVLSKGLQVNPLTGRRSLTMPPRASDTRLFFGAVFFSLLRGTFAPFRMQRCIVARALKGGEAHRLLALDVALEVQAVGIGASLQLPDSELEGFESESLIVAFLGVDKKGNKPGAASHELSPQ